jgi:hypothetical protein
VKARVERTEKSIESIGEGIVVGAGFAVGGLGARFSLFASSRLEVASRLGPRQRLCRGLSYAMGYARTTGRRDGFGADGRKKSKSSGTLAYHYSTCPISALPGVEGCRANGKPRNSGVNVTLYAHEVTMQGSGPDVPSVNPFVRCPIGLPWTGSPEGTGDYCGARIHSGRTTTI